MKNNKKQSFYEFIIEASKLAGIDTNSLDDSGVRLFCEYVEKLNKHKKNNLIKKKDPTYKHMSFRPIAQSKSTSILIIDDPNNASDTY